jgi:hypothetical protein
METPRYGIPCTGFAAVLALGACAAPEASELADTVNAAHGGVHVATHSLALQRPRLAKTPPMGFNTWNNFGRNYHENVLIEIADALVASGMRDAGYIYLGSDDA